MLTGAVAAVEAELSGVAVQHQLTRSRQVFSSEMILVSFPQTSVAQANSGCQWTSLILDDRGHRLRFPCRRSSSLSTLARITRGTGRGLQ